MQKFHKTNEVVNYLRSAWYFLIMGYQIVTGIILIGLVLIIELFKALRDMRKKGTISRQQQHLLYPNNWTSYVKKTSRDSKRDLAMKRWRQ